MTEQLYYKDSALLEFAATVKRTADAADALEVILDRTAFYPEGGGQPCDLGTLNGMPVGHVRKQDGEIVHVLPHGADDHSGASRNRIAAGDTVAGVVDAARRRDYMQQHTGQHIISASLLKVGAYNTVSVHLGADYSTIEIDAPAIPPADLVAAEEAANAAIEAALPVTARVVGDEEIGRVTLRRPPKVRGSIRLVTVEEADCVACGGVHVDNTCRVRLVRLIGMESIRGRVRLYWKIGDRAIADYRMASTVIKELGDTLSAQPHEISERVRKQEERIRDVESELKKERERTGGLTAERLLSAAVSETGRTVVTAEFRDEDKEFLRGVAKALSEREGLAACMTNVGGDQLQWSIVLTDGAALQYQTLKDELLPLVDGRGGGRPPMWQGVGARSDLAGEFLAAFVRIADAGRHA